MWLRLREFFNTHKVSAALIAVNLTIILVYLILSACTQYIPYTAEEREYNRVADVQNWSLCREVYDTSAFGTFYCHNHTHNKGQRLRPWDVKEDLNRNNCRRVLGPLWADHIPKEPKNEEDTDQSRTPERVAGSS
jgi:hypothetical protein